MNLSNQGVSSDPVLFLKELANDEKQVRLQAVSMGRANGVPQLIGAGFIEHNELKSLLLVSSGLHLGGALMLKYLIKSPAERKYHAYLEGAAESPSKLVLDLKNEYRNSRYFSGALFAVLGLSYSAGKVCETKRYNVNTSAWECVSDVTNDYNTVVKSILFGIAATFFLVPGTVERKCNEFLNQESQISLYPFIHLDGASLALNIQF